MSRSRCRQVSARGACVPTALALGQTTKVHTRFHVFALALVLIVAQATDAVEARFRCHIVRTYCSTVAMQLTRCSPTLGGARINVCTHASRIFEPSRAVARVARQWGKIIYAPSFVVAR